MAAKEMPHRLGPQRGPSPARGDAVISIGLQHSAIRLVRETVSELKGNAVVIEEKMERGQIDRKFELSPDGTTKFGQMREPVVIKTVYQRAGDVE